MAKREKKIVICGVTSEAMEQAFAEYAIADAKMEEINARMDVEFAKIREKNADELAKWKKQKEENADILRTYTVEHPELFVKKKSFETPHGVIGYRTGTPKLKTLKGFTWASVTNMLKEFLPCYVRVAEEVAKDKLIADRDKEEVSTVMGKCGVIVVQEESFYIDLKKEDTGQD